MPSNGKTYAAGTWYVAAKPAPERSSKRLRPSSAWAPTRPPIAVPSANALRLRRPRVGLWDQYGGSMDSGWARWILEQYQFQFQKVFPPTIDAGNLNAAFDVLVIVEGGIPAVGAGPGAAQPAAADIPAEYRPMLGRMTARPIDSRAAPLHRKRRHRHHHRSLVDQPGASPQTADRGSPRRGRQAAARRKVLYARVDPHGQGRRVASRRSRPQGAHRHVFRHQSRVPARARPRPVRVSSRWPGSTRPRRSRVAGRGDSSICRTASPRLKRRLEGASVAVRSGDHQARAAARHIQVPLQRIFQSAAQEDRDRRS